MIGWLRRVFRRDHPRPPATNGHIEALETEQARLVARLESAGVRVGPLPSAARDRFERELAEAEAARRHGGRR